MWFETIVALLLIWLAYRFWTRRNPDAEQQPGERWKIIDARDCSSGSVHLMQSENDGTWIVQTVPADENTKSKIVRYANERQAREAFIKAQ